jgi:hypothetical protein
MMLVQTLRMHMTDCVGQGTGWLYALAEKRLGHAIAAMHADPLFDAYTPEDVLYYIDVQ